MQAQVVVTTIQSLAARNRFLHEFAPTDFQLIISDEAHRTISGNNRAIFEYFVGAKLGLTATPRDYLKGLKDTDRQNDPREYERRLLLDTYRTFGSDDGKPTFRYTLLNAVQHVPPYLCNPVTLDARTDITTQMLSDEGYTVTVPANEDGQEQELVFGKKDYERKFFSDETNLSFVRCFLDNAKCDPITGEVGKTIMFAVSRKHATKLVTLLNEEATRRWPKEYAAGSTFAVQVTSDIPGAQQMTIDFANNNLNGKSKWRTDDFRDYDTSRTRVCVTVGMMTTGYDCEDLLNVALARPIFSPTDFIQIKGRGTRLFTFKHGEGASQRTAKKDGFALFDFFANCEYFEEDFDYDQKLSLPKGPPEEGGAVAAVAAASASTISPTPRLTRWRRLSAKRLAFSGCGLTARCIASVSRNRPARPSPVTPFCARHTMMRTGPPSRSASAVCCSRSRKSSGICPKLQEVYKTDRLPSLREILARVFGLIPEIPTRSQLADEAFERFVATQPTNAVHSRELKVVFVAFLLDEGSRFLLQEGKFAELRARDASLYGSLSRLEPQEREALIGYLQSNVHLSEFTWAA